MNIAHCLIDDKWSYPKCYKKGFDWINNDTKEVIDRTIIHNITNVELPETTSISK